MSSPTSAETTKAIKSAAQNGRLKNWSSPAPPENHQVKNAPSITMWPWAKLKTSDALKMRTIPSAIRPMIPPFKMPVTICCGTSGQFIQSPPNSL